MSSSHFDHIAEAYDESLPAHVVEHYLQKRSRYIAARCPRGSVLDVGCGTGALAARLAHHGYDVTGIDPSEGMLAVARARDGALRTAQASGTSIPFADDSFDLVYCVAVMHHIAAPADVRRTLAEMVRVSAPGGRILIWDHNPRNPYWGRLMARVPQDTGEERLVSEQEIKSGLKAAGARIVSSEQLGLIPDFVPPRGLGIAAALERAFEAVPGLRRVAAHNVILAEKPRASGRKPSEPSSRSRPTTVASAAGTEPGTGS